MCIGKGFEQTPGIPKKITIHDLFLVEPELSVVRSMYLVDECPLCILSSEELDVIVNIPNSKGIYLPIQ